MIVVIIAGGSGTRLWPLSTPEYPKHLLKLTGERSLLQSAYDRATETADEVYVVTEASHAHHVAEQLPQLPKENVLIEPGRRGTGNCIVFALDIISRSHDHAVPIAFVHSDHHIRDVEGSEKSLHTAAEASTSSGKITLVGIEPTYPSTGFGYIERDGEVHGVEGASIIQSFKEKPDLKTAQKYLNAGNYLWNCGYFVGSVDIFLSEIRRVSPELTESYDTLAAITKPLSSEYNAAYLEFPNLVIDYALSEKSDNLAVVPASFDWMDIGSFKDLHEISNQDAEGNYTNGGDIELLDATNSFVRNETSTPVAVIGLDNVVVINSPNGVLVVNKNFAQKAGEVAKKLQEKQ